MFKYLKLKGKLLISFFLVTCIATVSTTAFSLHYFSAKIQSEALENLHKDVRVAELLYKEKVATVKRLTDTLANDGTFRILVQVVITQKLTQYLTEFLEREGLQQIVVTDTDFQVIGQSRGGGQSLQFDTQEKFSGHPLLQKAATLSGGGVASIEAFPGGEGVTLVAISAASPIFKTGRVVSRKAPKDAPPASELTGFVLVRYVLNANLELVDKIRQLLEVKAAVYHAEQGISYNPALYLTPPRLPAAASAGLQAPDGRYLEKDMRYGGQFGEYITLTDLAGKPAAVLGISVSADNYLETLYRAVWNLVGIMLTCIVGASLLGYLLARSILVPVQKLLDGVKRVTAGDLSYEIGVDLRDELGILARSFNSMSKQLHELFSTLEQRVENATHKLQNTLAHLAAIIDNMADGLLVTDIEGKIIRYNPVLAEMFPEHRDMLGQHCATLSTEIGALVETSRRMSGEAHTVELGMNGERIGQAAATAILQKDSFAEGGDNAYSGSKYLGSVILVRDITREKEIDEMMANTIHTLTYIGTALSAEKNLQKLLEMFVEEACKTSRADGGTLYTVEDDHLNFEIVRNASMQVRMGGTSGNPISLLPLPMNESKISAYAAIHKQIIYAPDVYANKDFDFSGTKEYDAMTGYRTNAMLVVPLLDRNNETVGVLQLINPIDPKTGQPGHFDKNQTEIVFSLASQAAVAIENARNYEKIERKNAAFKRFVPTEFLRHLGKEEVEDIKLGDATQESMTVLFADIRAFTHLSETMSPDDNFHFLNEYLNFIGPSITGNHGFIDKYIGDAIMALFSGTERNTAADGVKAAVGMFSQLRKFNQARREQGRPAIAIGVGIHSGPLILGTIGFEDRMESTVIGDTVNLASRVESFTKLYQVEMCITDATRRSLDGTAGLGIREIDTVQVKGKEQPVTMYEIIDINPPEIVEQKFGTLDRFHEALGLYKHRQWQDASRIFGEIRDAHRFADPIVDMYVQRCRDLLARPPLEDTWTGVTRLTEK